MNPWTEFIVRLIVSVLKMSRWQSLRAENEEIKTHASTFSMFRHKPAQKLPELPVGFSVFSTGKNNQPQLTMNPFSPLSYSRHLLILFFFLRSPTIFPHHRRSNTKKIRIQSFRKEKKNNLLLFVKKKKKKKKRERERERFDRNF